MTLACLQLTCGAGSLNSLAWESCLLTFALILQTDKQR